MKNYLSRICAMFLCALATVGISVAAPIISNGGVLNSASYLTPGLPASGIALGSIFVIFGHGLGPATLAKANSYPLSNELGGASGSPGTSVTVTVGSVSKPAPMVYTSATQVAAIMPSNMPTGSGTITVSYAGETSSSVDVQIVSSAFGTYALNQGGSGQAIATDPAYGVNTLIHTFHPGDVATLWGTGLGAITGDDAAAPVAGNLSAPVDVFVGDTTASVLYHGRSGCCAGLDQIAFRIPASVNGCYVPVGVRVGGVVSNITTIAVSNDGQICQDSAVGTDILQKVAAGQSVNLAYGMMYRNSTNFQANNQLQEIRDDEAFATFSTITPANVGLINQGVSSGYCVAKDCSNGCLPIFDSVPANLNSGSSVSISGPLGVRNLSNVAAGWYQTQLNSQQQLIYLSVGSYTMSGPGSGNVGPFSVKTYYNDRVPSLFNPKDLNSVDRTTDMVVKWIGADTTQQNGWIVVDGQAVSGDFSLIMQYFCKAPVSATQLTVPSWVLSTLPQTGTFTNAGNDTEPTGTIYVGLMQNPQLFTAPGIDKGLFIPYAEVGQFIQFK